jgi:pimeloyl-ACP methyl ester carboxylesterase
MSQTSALLPDNAEWQRLKGDGHPAHFYHANGFALGAYAPLLRHLSRAYDVSALKMRPTWSNCGTIPQKKDWHIYADDLIAFIERESQAPVIGIGHSMGAVCTLYAADKRPDLFKAIVLIEPAMLTRFQARMIRFLPKFITNRHEPAKSTLAKQDTWTTREEFNAHCRAFKGFRRFGDEELAALIEHGVVEKPDGTFGLTFPKEWEAHNYSQPPNVMDELSRVKVPCVGIRGKPSVFFLEAMWDEWQRSCPATEFFEDLAHGHLFPLENGSRCFELIQKGLNEIL